MCRLINIMLCDVGYKPVILAIFDCQNHKYIIQLVHVFVLSFVFVVYGQAFIGFQAFSVFISVSFWFICEMAHSRKKYLQTYLGEHIWASHFSIKIICQNIIELVSYIN